MDLGVGVYVFLNRTQFVHALPFPNTPGRGMTGLSSFLCSLWRWREQHNSQGLRSKHPKHELAAVAQQKEKTGRQVYKGEFVVFTKVPAFEYIIGTEQWSVHRCESRFCFEVGSVVLL